ncbi:MAG: TetR/AcrR family transcriptional regulator [Lactobacillales bacterium]|jgi:hypothetical protein|nr:TetR/AcrR family transcriptional regulator [Lactobacillales bacterium]
MKDADTRYTKAEKQILKSFISQLKTQNFQDISVNQLTKLAGIHRSTFYAHYLDKDDLLNKFILKIVHKNFGSVTGNVLPLSQEFSWELLVWTRETIDGLKATFGIHYPSISSTVDTIIVKFLEELLDNRIRDSVFDDHTGYIDYIAILMSTSIYALAHESSKRNQKVEEIHDYFKRMDPIRENMEHQSEQ